MDKGLIHIYTGNGKGKTTTSVGLATRALGHGLKVCYCHFLKQPEKYGYNEIGNLEKLGATILGFTDGDPMFNKNINTDQLSFQVKDALLSIEKVWENFDLLILDEINIALRDNYISEDRLIEFLDEKPEKLELVLTGRGASKRLIEKADYVSEINKVKHPYDKGINARKGIEY